MTHGVPSLRRLAAEAVVTHDLNPAPLPQDLISYVQHVVDLEQIENEPPELLTALHALGTAIMQTPREDYRDATVRGGLAAQAGALAERADRMLRMIGQAVGYIAQETDAEWKKYFTAVCASANAVAAKVKQEAELLKTDLQNFVEEDESDTDD